MSEKVTNRDYFALYKPYGFLCQFTGEESDQLLGDLYTFPKDVYSIGRLDKDSEGLLLLTNDNQYKTQLLDPKNHKYKTYWVQVEGSITKTAVEKLCSGTIQINHKGKKHKVDQALCKTIAPPDLPERVPSIRTRLHIPTSWIELKITEGKNRQVRKMTAAIGFPTLRLIRTAMGSVQLQDLKPGEVRRIFPT
ncbi:MAG: pseudouridine synthase [Crocinitomicaceae bacterium]|jgi:23S rRNA pseudouridine2457 synthase|nr:pseudouridine synthase [Crocinitomicaceae bacterium]MDG1742289.1 pseudouridine synthase [Crocinitomicaceae bacterium]